MNSHHDARCPAQGVKVMPVCRPRVTGLSMAQAQGMRKTSFVESGGLKPHPLCSPIKTSGGGLPPSMLVAKGLPGHHHHAHRKPGKKNPCFYGKIPSQVQYNREVARKELAGLRSMLVRLCQNRKWKFDLKAERNYVSARTRFLKCFEEQKHELRLMEEQIRTTVR